MVSSFLCVGARRPGFLLRRNYTARHPRVSNTQQDAPAAHSPAAATDLTPTYPYLYQLQIQPFL